MGDKTENFVLGVNNATHLKYLRDAKFVDERFHDVIESMPDAIVMVNSTGLIVLVNTQAEKLFGWSREELLGQKVEMLVPERFRKRHPEHRSGFFAQPRTRHHGCGTGASPAP